MKVTGGRFTGVLGRLRGRDHAEREVTKRGGVARRAHAGAVPHLGLGACAGLAAVAMSQSRGATVVEGSIFGPVPGGRMWATALLLDGNIGIGGDPVALLARVASMIRPCGRILVELGPPGTSGAAELARVEHDACMGPWFAWTAVGASCIGAISAEAGLGLTSSWSAGGR